jgi:hypothetical protein
VAIYRPPKRRWPLAAAAGLAGIVIGIAAAAVLASEPDPVESLRVTKSQLAQASAVLEVAEVEYSEAVENGEIESQAEYDGALGALDRSRALFLSAAPVVRFADSDVAGSIERSYDEIRATMEAPGSEEEVAALLEELAAQLDGALGG